jgi:hypothetical protein
MAVICTLSRKSLGGGGGAFVLGPERRLLGVR